MLKGRMHGQTHRHRQNSDLRSPLVSLRRENNLIDENNKNNPGVTLTLKQETPTHLKLFFVKNTLQ
jgi:hypothetical protein